MNRSMKCRNNYLLVKLLACDTDRKTVADKLRTGYRPTGIEAAGILHRLLYGTWEATITMCEKPYRGLEKS